MSSTGVCRFLTKRSYTESEISPSLVLLEPYKSGALNIFKAFAKTAQGQVAPTKLQRVVHFGVGLSLIFPIINIIVFLAVRRFALKEEDARQIQAAYTEINLEKVRLESVDLKTEILTFKKYSKDVEKTNLKREAGLTIINDLIALRKNAEKAALREAVFSGRITDTTLPRSQKRALFSSEYKSMLQDIELQSLKVAKIMRVLLKRDVKNCIKKINDTAEIGSNALANNQTNLMAEANQARDNFRKLIELYPDLDKSDLEAFQATEEQKNPAEEATNQQKMRAAQLTRIDATIKSIYPDETKREIIFKESFKEDGLTFRSKFNKILDGLAETVVTNLYGVVLSKPVNEHLLDVKAFNKKNEKLEINKDELKRAKSLKGCDGDIKNWGMDYLKKPKLAKTIEFKGKHLNPDFKHVHFKQMPALSQNEGSNNLCGYYALFFLQQAMKVDAEEAEAGAAFLDRKEFLSSFKEWYTFIWRKDTTQKAINAKKFAPPERKNQESRGLIKSQFRELIKSSSQFEDLKESDQVFLLEMDNVGGGNGDFGQSSALSAFSSLTKPEIENPKWNPKKPAYIILKGGCPMGGKNQQTGGHYYFLSIRPLSKAQKKKEEFKNVKFEVQIMHSLSEYLLSSSRSYEDNLKSILKCLSQNMKKSKSKKKKVESD